MPLAAGPHRWLLATIRPSAALFGLAAVLVIVLTTLTGGLIWHLRLLALDEATREARNLDLVIAEQIARSLQHVDFLLRALADRLPNTDGKNGRPMAEQMAEQMAALTANTPQLRGLSVAGPDGMIYERANQDRVPFYIGDRSIFTAQRDNATLGLFVSEPFVSRSDGRPMIGVSRRINRPDGSFNGIVAAAVEPSYFTAIYGALDLHRASIVTVLREDGTCLMRYPSVQGDGAQGDGALCATEPGSAAHLHAAASGIYRDRDPGDGMERIVTYDHADGLPLVSMVSTKVDTVLKDWRRQARMLSIAAFVAAAILCALIFMLAKEMGRREALAAALRANEERFRNFAEASSDWFWEQDETLRFSYLSDAVFEKSGLPVAAHLGKTRREVVTRGVSAEQWRQHEADLQARRPFRDFRIQRPDAAGRMRHISVSGKPVFDANGRFRGYAGNARDITREITAEQRLIETKAEAEAASRTKSDFLAIISHELRTPLNAIIGFSDVINREVLGPIGSVKYREYAGDILSAGRHLLGLINNILDMSKIEAQKMQLFEEVVEVAALAASSVKIVERLAADTQITLAIDIPQDLPRLRGDEMRLKQILVNLLSNAVKFTAAKGSVTLSARLLADGALEIAVADTGIGMSEEELVLALEPFRQVESALARRHEGTGLGLPLVKAFVEMHDGTLTLHSVSGEGTTARVVLPAARVVVSASAPARQAVG
ncbi:MAG TPA: ATP-binding protein [Stellaceae bacterium]|nr:ATP-binding protein [Stellaceae bacterium]